MVAPLPNDARTQLAALRLITRNYDVAAQILARWPSSRVSPSASDNERVRMIHAVSVDNDKLDYVNSFSLGSPADD